MEARGAKKAGEGSSLLGGIDLNLVVLFVFALVIPFALGTADRIFGDGDVSWHIAAGQWMISHGKVPFTDPFSFSAAGRPWIAHEWLSEVVMGAAYNLAGWGGIAALVSASRNDGAVSRGARLRASTMSNRLPAHRPAGPLSLPGARGRASSAVRRGGRRRRRPSA